MIITLNSPCWNQQERQLEVQASSASPSHSKEEIGGLPHQPFSLHTQLVLLKVLFLVIVILLLLQSPEFSFLSWLALLMCSRTLKLPEQRNAHLEVFLCCFVSINKLDETNKHTSTGWARKKDFNRSCLESGRTVISHKPPMGIQQIELIWKLNLLIFTSMGWWNIN